MPSQDDTRAVIGTQGDALSQLIVQQRPELAGRVHYVDGRPWCDGVNHTTRCEPGEAMADDERQRWRAALEDALDGLEDMFPYVPEYFREKWGHQGHIDRTRQALADLT